MTIFYVYYHIDPITNDIRYVGKGTNKRAWCLSGRNRHHSNWIKSLKRINFVPEIKIIKSFKFEKDAFIFEKKCIAQLKPLGKLVNYTDGGEGISNPIQSVREKISNSRTGDKNPAKRPEVRAKISKTLSQKRLPDHVKKAIGDSNRGKKRSDFFKEYCRRSKIGPKNPMFGKKGKHHHKSKSVICINTGKQFESIAEASSYYNISKSGIVQNLKGRLMTIKGMAFKYV